MIALFQILLAIVLLKAVNLTSCFPKKNNANKKDADAVINNSVELLAS